VWGRRAPLELTLTLRGTQAWARSGVAALGLAAVVGSTTLIAVDAASGRSRLVDDGHALPHGAYGPLAGLGSTLYVPRFLVLLVAMSAGYAALVWANALSARAAVAAIVALNTIVFLAPPISSDVFSYLDYARLGALHGVNPYAYSPAAVPGDPAYHFMGAMWRHFPSAYGPLFTLGSYPAALLGLVGGVWFLKGVAALSSLALVAVVAACARRLGRDPVRAALLVGANPFVLVWGVAAGHNDLLMLALAMLGTWLVVSGRQASGAGAAVAAAAVKASAIVVLPFMLVASRPRGRAIAGAAVSAAAVAAVAVAAFGTHAAGFAEVLRRQQDLFSSNAFSELVARLFGAPAVPPAGQTLLHLLLLAAVVYLLVRVWRGADWISGAGWALLATALTATWLLAWYTIWALPFAVLGRDRRLLAAVLTVQALFLFHRLSPVFIRW
jgi:alpha-1,6-mannosyltransferase